MNGEMLNTLVGIKCEMTYLNELLGRTDMLIGDCTNTLTGLEKKGNALCGDELTPTVNHLDIYGAYLSELIFDAVNNVQKQIDALIEEERAHGK
jgi:hypothetical protein